MLLDITFVEPQNVDPYVVLSGGEGGQKMPSYFQGGMPIAVRMRTGGQKRPKICVHN